MIRTRLLSIFVVACTLWAAPAAASTTSDPADTGVLRVADHRDRAEAVAPWDPSSPQRLVRIDGALFQEQADRYYPVVADRITVRLAEGIDTWDDLLARAAVESPDAYDWLAWMQPVRANRLGIFDLQVPPGDVARWCERVHGTGLVRYAEVATRGTYLVTPTDPRYPEQWAMNNTGQSGGTPGADIDAERAWDLTSGDPSIIVAILDSGTAVDHEDLAANVWHNAGETPGNGVDDDGNGYVDDWEGWNFERNDGDPRTTNDHGTSVTGIVNAAGGNGVGMAGVAGGVGSPGVQGMAVCVGSSSPISSAVDDAILYAADNGARVITMSLAIGESQAINDALDYAYHTRDVFIDCATGNAGDAVAYPATRPEVVAVGATTHDDTLASFSNRGPEVEVVAPGNNVLSTGLADSYRTNSGTSFAAPYVAGLAGLVRSRNPGLTAADVRQIILDTADDVDAPGFDDRTGHGRINAYAAVRDAASSDGTVRLDAPSYACGDGVGVTISDYDLAGAAPFTVRITSDSESGGEDVVVTEAGTGSGVFRGTIATATGTPAPDGILQVAHGDTIVVEYVDADDGQGGTNVVKTDDAGVDCRAPGIASVSTTDITDSSATVTWTTDEPATSLARYGTTVPPALEATAPNFVTAHAVPLNGLSECTTYRYEVESSDPDGNTAVDDDAGAYHVFRTMGDFPGVGVAPCTRGRVALDRTGTYGCDDTVGVTVTDIDLDTDPGVVETVAVLMTSSTEPSGEWITLTETGTQSAWFDGPIDLTPSAAVAGDGLLSVSAGDLITATYHDGDDGTGTARSVTATSTADCTAPFLTDLRVTGITSTRGTVEWTTDEPATTRVEYGPTPALGQVWESLALTTSHSAPVSGLDACDRAYFRVSSADAHGDVRVADAGGSPLAFHVQRIPGLVYFETFETDTGWTLPGDWERGTPQGLGSNGGDPDGAWSGDGAIGNDLSGAGSAPGDYESTSSASAISPVFSTRQQRDMQLIVRRKLGVLSADEAGIYILNGTTNQVWTSTYQVNDTDWYEYRKDISPWADNKSSVQLEFRLESLNADTSYGWNIDEVIVKDRTLPDYEVCGGCTGGPGFAGVTAAYDPDPCGAGGLVVEWQAAAAWGSGSGGTYDVHRGTSAGFTPDASNRIASGLTANTWTDSSAPVDTPVWYVVRARNDESCGADGGMTDDNTVRLGATETTSQALPAPVGDVVVAHRIGGAHVRLEWTPSGGADHYVVRRATSWDFADATDIGTTAASWFEDAGAAGDGTSYSYRVFAVDTCGRIE